jgi:hypothetical protein
MPKLNPSNRIQNAEHTKYRACRCNGGRLSSGNSWRLAHRMKYPVCPTLVLSDTAPKGLAHSGQCDGQVELFYARIQVPAVGQALLMERVSNRSENSYINFGFRLARTLGP